MTISEHSLWTDRRVTDAIQLLQQAVADHQSQLGGVRPPAAEKTEEYAEALKQMGELRGGPLFYPYLSSGLGRGALVELADGSVKYDFITGIGVHYAGHSHPQLIAAGIRAALSDTVMQGNLQQDVPSLRLIDTLVKTAQKNGGRIRHAFLTSSGAMANENALKMIFQKHAPARRFLAFQHCFAGRSMVMAQVTDKPANRDGLPAVLDVDYVPFYDVARPAESTAEAVNVLQGHLAAYPGGHAGMIMELIQGEGGYYPGSRDFFLALIRILKEHSVAVFVDEIQTFGRTAEPFAFQTFGLDDHVDVVTIGKMSQACVTLFTDDYRPRPGLISQTFTASSSAIRAGQAILDELLGGGYLGPDGQIMQISSHFRSGLEHLAAEHPDRLRGPFGFGAMVAMTVLDGKPETAKRFLHILFEEGVLSFVAGRDPVRVRFLMPLLAVTPSDIDDVLRLIARALERVAAEPRGEGT